MYYSLSFRSVLIILLFMFSFISIPLKQLRDRQLFQGKHRLFSWARPDVRKKIAVFISSPGDCSFERDLAKKIILTLNDDPAIVKQKIAFHPLLWEELPPGVVKDGDVQAHLFRRLQRFDYDTYGIYLGFMKSRLGTPTPKAGSGTVEEFEESLRGRKFLGHPSEILFYFIGDDQSRPQNVLDFKLRIQEGGYLTAQVTDDNFQERLTQNLSDIARSWNQWHYILRRIWKRTALAFGASLIALAGVALLADTLSMQKISDAIALQDLNQAAEIWSSRRIGMPLSRARARRVINSKYLEEVNVETDILEQLRTLRLWTETDVFTLEIYASVIDELEQKADAVVEGYISEGETTAAFNIIRTGRGAGLWSGNSKRLSRHVESLAAERLMRALVDANLPAFKWRGAAIDAHGAEILRRFASTTLEYNPNLSGWKDRAMRSAIAFWGNNHNLLSMLSVEAVRMHDEYEPIEFALLRETATDAELAAFVSKISDTAPPHVLSSILDKASTEGFTKTIDALVRHSASPASTDFSEILNDAACRNPVCTTYATAAFIKWSSDGFSLSISGLLFLLPSVDPQLVSSVDRSLLAQRLVKEAELFESKEPDLLRLLGGLSQPVSDSYLDVQIVAHIVGSVSFGFAQKEALIDVLKARTVSSQSIERARGIVEAAERDQQNVPQRTWTSDLGGIFQPSLVGVDRAYLALLAGRSTLLSAEDITVVDRIIDRARDGGPRYSERDVLTALGSVLNKFGERSLLERFAFPGPGLADPPWEPIWTRRRLFLTALIAVPARPRPEIAQGLFSSLSADDDLRLEFWPLVAQIEPEYAQLVFATHLAEGDIAVLPLIATLGERAPTTLSTFIRTITDETSESTLIALIESIVELDEGTQKPLFRLLLERRPDMATSIIAEASIKSLNEPILLDAAIAVVKTPEKPRTLGRSIAYLIEYTPETLEQLLEIPAVASSWRNFLLSSSAFEWLIVAQEFGARENTINPLVVVPAPIANARRILIALDDDTALPTNHASGWLLVGNGKRVSNPLIWSFASSADSIIVRDVIGRLLASSDPVESIGDLENADEAFRAYLLWMLARTDLGIQEGCSGSLSGILTSMFEADRSVRYAAASLILAAPEHFAVDSTCW